MFPVSSGVHLDEFTLLRRHTRDLDESERVEVDRHLEGCADCAAVMREIQQIDAGLRALLIPEAAEPLAPEDPFAVRPEWWVARSHAERSMAEAPSTRALAASERGVVECERLMIAAATVGGDLGQIVAGLTLSDAAHRFGLVYWMQTAGLEISRGHLRALALARAVLEAVDRDAAEEAARNDVERLLPLEAIEAEAYLLAGKARLWTGEYQIAGEELETAYRLFGRSTGDPASLAIVELNESQRRSFLSKGVEGLHLARRATHTFESLGLEDYVARGQLAQANALFFLGRPEEALTMYRAVAPVMESRELWSHYVGAVNSAGECLIQLGRPEEARREYARALRRLLGLQEPTLTAFIRHGLANSLFHSARYREAALSFERVARMNHEVGLTGNGLIATLFEIESWARHGDVVRAAERLQRFQADVARHGSFDASILAELDRAMSGRHPDLKRVAETRERAETLLRELFLEAPAKKTS